MTPSEGLTPANAATPGELGELLLEARLLDARGVLVGQSGGMKNERSSKSRTGGSGASRPLGTAKLEVSESGDDPRSYQLTKVAKPRFITLVFGQAAIPSPSRDRRRFILEGRFGSKSAVHWGYCKFQGRRCIGTASLKIHYGYWKGRISVLATPKHLSSDLLLSGTLSSSFRTFPNSGSSDDPMGGQSIEPKLLPSSRNDRGTGGRRNGGRENVSDSSEGSRRYRSECFNNPVAENRSRRYSPVDS
jgi:hypothetical protein